LVRRGAPGFSKAGFCGECLICDLVDASKDDDEEVNPFRESPARYTAYVARLKALFVKSVIKAKRYVAYSSDVGETLRPVLSPAMVQATYAIAGAYILGDCFYLSYKEWQHDHNVQEARLTLAHGLVFQGLASLIIPMYSIHWVVHQAQLRFAELGRFQRWGPSVVGFAVIPFLPLIDEPIEHAIDMAFDSIGCLPESRRRAEKEHKH